MLIMPSFSIYASCWYDFYSHIFDLSIHATFLVSNRDNTLISPTSLNLPIILLEQNVHIILMAFVADAGFNPIFCLLGEDRLAP